MRKSLIQKKDGNKDLDLPSGGDNYRFGGDTIYRSGFGS
jgi:hypothetical protein